MSSDRPDVAPATDTPSEPPSSGQEPPASANRLRTLTRRVLPDLAPWRSSRDFRLLLSSGLITTFGSYLTYVAVPLQIMRMTDSPLAVGLVGLVELVPLIVFGLWGGALADAMNRRRLIMGCEAGLALLSLLLLVNSQLPSPQLWLLYVVAGLTAVLDGMQRPSLDALTPQVVPHDQLPAASALLSLRSKVGAILAPALAGVIAATAGVSAAYALDFVTFLVSMALLSRIRATPPPDGGEPPSLASILVGLKYAWSRKDLLGTYAVDVIAMMCAFPTAIFPFLAYQLHAPWALGMLYSAGAVGGLAVSLTSGWYSRVHRHGRLVLIAAAMTGVAMAGAGFTQNVWLVLFFLAVAGGADMVSGLGRDTMWNQSIPDELRGRMAGVELLSYTVGPKLGDVRAGYSASRWGASGSMWVGGLACLVGVAALAVALPKMLAYDDRTDPNALAVGSKRKAAEAPAAAEAGKTAGEALQPG
ncbi:MFS transporter [Streptomyces sp. NPDC005181]|uniref:MFS transporter n=1 Tax=Streptomyces sp. NPDC005181 TaxID=3156869 RepID=UPI0033AE734C